MTTENVPVQAAGDLMPLRLPPIILASASPRRAALLRSAGFRFTVVAADVPEIQPGHLTPHEIAQINACRKCRRIAQQHPDALVLGADTIVCLEQQIFGKPASRDEAGRMLAKLQGRTHQVVTGVCCLHLRAHRRIVFVASTRVTFRSLGADQIHRYLAKIDPLDKAGAYAIQEEGDDIVLSFEGSYSNVVGLPLERLTDALRGWAVV